MLMVKEKNMKQSKIFGCIGFLCLVFFQSTDANQNEVYGEPQLVVEAYAGDQSGKIGIVTERDIMWPIDFAIDPDGAIWIMDIANRKVHKFNQQGEFVLSFPNLDHQSPLELRTTYIESDVNGNIYIGPIRGSLIVIDKHGTFLKQITLPGVPVYVDFDFAVDNKGHILYRKNKDLVAVDQNGEVQYAISDFYAVGEHSSPYSKYRLGYKQGAYKVFDTLTKKIRNNVINNTVFGRNSVRDSSGIEKRKQARRQARTSGNSMPAKINGQKNIVFLVNNERNVFVKQRLGKGIAREIIFYRKPNGLLIQKLNMPTYGTEKLHTQYTIDKDGNLYLLESYIPQNTTIEGGKLITGGTPAMRVWKWAKQR